MSQPAADRLEGISDGTGDYLLGHLNRGLKRRIGARCPLCRRSRNGRCAGALVRCAGRGDWLSASRSNEETQAQRRDSGPTKRLRPNEETQVQRRGSGSTKETQVQRISVGRSDGARGLRDELMGRDSGGPGEALVGVNKKGRSNLDSNAPSGLFPQLTNVRRTRP